MMVSIKNSVMHNYTVGSKLEVQIRKLFMLLQTIRNQYFATLGCQFLHNYQSAYLCLHGW